jgi:hypothetical protein
LRTLSPNFALTPKLQHYRAMSFGDYVRQIIYALKVMVPADLNARDLEAGISLLCPHYQFWCRR